MTPDRVPVPEGHWPATGKHVPAAKSADGQPGAARQALLGGWDRPALLVSAVVCVVPLLYWPVSPDHFAERPVPTSRQVPAAELRRAYTVHILKNRGKRGRKWQLM